MICYQLQCGDEHVFEAWFANSAAYDVQVAAGQVQCPICGALNVRKALMAPNISLGRGAREALELAQIEERAAVSDDAMSVDQAGSDGGSGAGGADASAQDVQSASGAQRSGDSAGLSTSDRAALSAKNVDVMRKIRREVEAGAEDVGPRFAEEARKIHYEETQARAIFGQATPQEVKDLTEEGVDIQALPRLPEDNN